MMRSLYAGISGLKSHQTRMDVIGNNIANVNTTGFKASRATFQDMLSQTMQGAGGASGNRGGTNPMQIGLGVGVASIDTVFTDGPPQTTGKSTDLAIGGQGFFILGDTQNNKIYTRNGAFDFDTSGNLILPGTGYKVMGWSADSKGVIDPKPDAIQGINIPVGSSMAAQVSSTLTYKNNLSSAAKAIGTAAAIDVAKDALDAANTNVTTTATTLDSATTAASAAEQAAAAVIVTATNADTAAQATLDTATTANSDAQNAKAAAIQAKLDADAAKTAANAAVASGSSTDLTAAATAAATALASAHAARLVATPTTLASATQAETDANAVKTAADAAVASGLPADAVLTQTAAGTAQTSAGTAQTTAANAAATTATAFNTATTAKIDTAAKLTNVNALPASTANAKALATATIASTAAIAAQTAAKIAYDAANDKTSDQQTSISVYDTQGNEYKLSGVFEKTADNIWSFTPASTVVDSKGATVAKITGTPSTLVFDKNGVYDKNASTINSITIDPTGSMPVTPATVPPTTTTSPYAGAGKFTITAPDFSTMTQNGGATTAVASEQDGYAAGTLGNVTIDSTGTVVGKFTNNRTLNLAQVALAVFNNPGGLTKVGSSFYDKSSNSGEPQIGQSNTGGRGSFTPGALEMSNVDLAQQFSDMIVTQRGFQANSKIITTTDTMLEELVNLKR